MDDAALTQMLMTSSLQGQSQGQAQLGILDMALLDDASLSWFLSASPGEGLGEMAYALREGMEGASLAAVSGLASLAAPLPDLCTSRGSGGMGTGSADPNALAVQMLLGNGYSPAGHTGGKGATDYSPTEFLSSLDLDSRHPELDRGTAPGEDATQGHLAPMQNQHRAGSSQTLPRLSIPESEAGALECAGLGSRHAERMGRQAGAGFLPAELQEVGALQQAFVGSASCPRGSTLEEVLREQTNSCFGAMEPVSPGSLLEVLDRHPADVAWPVLPEVWGSEDAALMNGDILDTQNRTVEGDLDAQQRTDGGEALEGGTEQGPPYRGQVASKGQPTQPGLSNLGTEMKLSAGLQVTQREHFEQSGIPRAISKQAGDRSGKGIPRRALQAELAALVGKLAGDGKGLPPEPASVLHSVWSHHGTSASFRDLHPSPHSGSFQRRRDRSASGSRGSEATLSGAGVLGPRTRNLEASLAAALKNLPTKAPLLAPGGASPIQPQARSFLKAELAALAKKTYGQRRPVMPACMQPGGGVPRDAGGGEREDAVPQLSGMELPEGNATPPRSQGQASAEPQAMSTSEGSSGSTPRASTDGASLNMSMEQPVSSGSMSFVCKGELGVVGTQQAKCLEGAEIPGRCCSASSSGGSRGSMGSSGSAGRALSGTMPMWSPSLEEVMSIAPSVPCSSPPTTAGAFPGPGKDSAKALSAGDEALSAGRHSTELLNRTMSMETDGRVCSSAAASASPLRGRWGPLQDKAKAVKPGGKGGLFQLAGWSSGQPQGQGFQKRVSSRVSPEVAEQALRQSPTVQPEVVSARTALARTRPKRTTPRFEQPHQELHFLFQNAPPPLATSPVPDATAAVPQGSALLPPQTTRGVPAWQGSGAAVPADETVLHSGSGISEDFNRWRNTSPPSLAGARREQRGVEGCQTCSAAQEDERSKGEGMEQISAEGHNQHAESRQLANLLPPVLPPDLSLVPPPPSNGTLRSLTRARVVSLAHAYIAGNQRSVSDLTWELRQVSSQAGCFNQKLAFHMLNALEKKFRGKALPMPLRPEPGRPPPLTPKSMGDQFIQVGWIPFAQMVNTYAVLHSLLGYSKVHVIFVPEDWTICWKTFFREIARQPGGAPQVCVTHVRILIQEGMPSMSCCTPPSTCSLHRAAKGAGVRLTHRTVAVPPHKFSPSLVATTTDEAIAVVSCWSLTFFPDKRVIEFDPRNAILRWIYWLSPKVLVLTEPDCDFNSASFLDRFEELINRRLPVMEAWDAMTPREGPGRAVQEFFLNQLVTDCVANEGIERLIRDERLEQWVERLTLVGFQAAPFPDQVWLSLTMFSRFRPSIRVDRHGELARLLWNGVPSLFSSAWVCS